MAKKPQSAVVAGARRGPRQGDGKAAATRARPLDGAAARPFHSGEGKAPRTSRGERTARKILDAALAEFGERGFSESSIVSITTRAKVALGTFYTYFDSKEALFAALVRDMSDRVRTSVAAAVEGVTEGFEAEERTLAAYLDFVVGHKEVYRIIDEAEFVDPSGYRAHYESAASRIAARLEAATRRGEIRDEGALANEVHAWAIMGMNVFLGLRFGVWGSEDHDAVARHAHAMLRNGLEV